MHTSQRSQEMSSVQVGCATREHWLGCGNGRSARRTTVANQAHWCGTPCCRRLIRGSAPQQASSRPAALACRRIVAAARWTARLVRRRHGPSRRSSSAASAISVLTERSLPTSGTRSRGHTASPVTAESVRMHTNFSHHPATGSLALLACDHDRAAVQKALLDWRAEEFEEAAAQAGLVVTAKRSFEVEDRHPQGMAVGALPAFSIERIGDAPAQPLPPARRPPAAVARPRSHASHRGSGVGRTLAAHGAERTARDGIPSTRD